MLDVRLVLIIFLVICATLQFQLRAGDPLCVCVCLHVAGLEGREEKGPDGGGQSRAGEMHYDAPHGLQGEQPLASIFNISVRFASFFKS